MRTARRNALLGDAAADRKARQRRPDRLDQSGDVYFYSPEQLDPNSPGVFNEKNLYVYRHGAVKYVATLDAGTAINRIQISPDGSHVAFLTAARLTSYDNQGWREMYTFNPDTGVIRCASCIPTGEPPTVVRPPRGSDPVHSPRKRASPSRDVTASQSGRFMSDDGRTAFATSDALVEGDTDGLVDVYEFVGGRPQLISSGTAQADLLPGQPLLSRASTPDSSRSATTASTSTSRPTTPWRPTKTSTASSSSSTTPARMEASRRRRPISPVSPRTSATVMKTRARRRRDRDRRQSGAAADAGVRTARSTKKQHKQARRHAQGRPPRRREPGMVSDGDDPRAATRSGRVVAMRLLRWALRERAPRSRKSPNSAPTSRARRRAATLTSTTRSSWTARGLEQPALQLRGRPHPRHALSDRVHRRPALGSGLHAGRILTARCAPESQVGVVDIQGSLREAIYNLVPHTDEPGLIGFYVPGSKPSVFIVLHARTGSDYGLDATTSADLPLLADHLDRRPHLGRARGFQPRRQPLPGGQTEGVECKPYPGGCFGAGEIERDAGPLSAESDHLRRPADGQSLDRILLRAVVTPRTLVAVDDRLRPAHLRPEPDGNADDRRGRQRVGPRRRRSKSRRRRARRRRRRRRSARRR